MVKSYLRYEAEHTFGLVCSPGPNHVALSSSGGLLLTAGLERLLVFHARQGTLLRSLALPESSSRAPTDSAAPAISCIAACPTHPHRVRATAAKAPNPEPYTLGAGRCALAVPFPCVPEARVQGISTSCCSWGSSAAPSLNVPESCHDVVRDP